MNKRETPDRLSTQSGSFWLHAKRSFRRITIKVVLLTVVLLWVFHAVTTPVMGQGRRPVTGQTVFKFPENPSSRFGTVITYSISGAEITEVFDRLQEPAHMGMYAREFQRENFGVRTGGERIALNGVIKAQQVQMVSELLISLECASSRDVIKMSVPYEDGVVHRTWDYPFNLSVSCPAGERFSMFIGVWIRHGDTMDYSEGFRISGPPAAWEPYPSTTRVGINGLLPGPETLLQALLGVLGPGLLAILIGLLGGHLPTYPPLPRGGPSPSDYVLSDGRTYREGQTYTFDEGRQYRFTNGEFVPIRDLRDGEVYTDPDGSRKIWIGGQPWYEADWRRQAATNDAYARAHKQDVDNYWDKRQQEIHEEQAAMHEKDEVEKAKDREIEEQREKVKELIKQTIRIQMEIDQIRVDIANRSAKLADRAYRTAEAIKYVCDKSIDIAAKIPGPKGEAFKAIRKAYRVTSAMAGGVGEGMASGNWTDSMVDATGAAVSNFIEDSIKTDRFKKGFEVFRGGTGEAWQQGRKAYRKGESIAGAAATGFVEGTAAEASKKAKEALEEFAPGSKYSYTIGESTFKAGYKEYKKGGDIGAVMRASGSGYMDGGIEAAMDYGVGKIFENVLPENVSEKTLADHIKFIEELEEQEIWMELYDTNRFPELKEMLKEDFKPQIIYDEIRKEANKVTTKATQNVVRGKAFDDKLYA